MESLQSIVTDFEKVYQKQVDSTLEIDNALQSLIDSFVDVRNSIASNPRALVPSMAILKQKALTSSRQISSQQEEVRRYATRHDKTLRGAYKTDLNNIWDPGAFDDREDVLAKTIALHFIREGQFNIADTFINEAGLDVPEDLKDRFPEMYRILEAIKEDNLEPAIQWASAHREHLDKRGSRLEFALHRAQFVQLLTSMRIKEALQYSKANFGHFAGTHMKEIQRLMGSFIYTKNLSNSPYADLLDPNQRADIQHSFTRDFCQYLGLSSDSPLYISVLVGTLALPTIIKMSSIMKDKSGLEWSQAGELPVEIPLSNNQCFHSVFACPVSKEQSTEENPPMLMFCGHVICKFCLDRLSKGNQNTRFKCPYCPTESTAGQSHRIHL
ncbi:CTLH/CRA C-terminal to lish motif domain-containing protein [Fimicolochytrium jonesii]|uniref:CTLH/CRA C-terminal to lish motif domain-containing protein n=1 Tax=Fimicolochytrium jonesii TaxID=1396493 RepID=UPI0022FF0781|nr:CTLH/CRA C-terminal to lish motif domain-containing protein [Fimicolochytrium jonesii]KAI8826683.1 CTLH/CRA C-terminal to lish motif domain-containing protein [Fimicolochytrium jonesii]